MQRAFLEGEVDFHQREVETQVLEAKLMVLPVAASSVLALREGDKGFILRRFRRQDGKVALYSENCLLPELEKTERGSRVMEPNGSLNLVLKESGYRTVKARRSVEAVSVPARIAELLSVPPGAPLLLVTPVSWTRDGRPFDYNNSWVRTDVVKVTVEAKAARKQE